MALAFGVRCFNFRVQDLGFPLLSKDPVSCSPALPF